MPQAQWTVLLYMVPDEDLKKDAVKDIVDFKTVGSTDDVNIVAQLDPIEKRLPTVRYRFQKGTSLEEDVLRSIPEETNSGDVNVLRSFLKWGVTNFPAQHYMVVLWGHGSGWAAANEWTKNRRPPVSSVERRCHRKRSLLAPAGMAADKGDGKVDYLDSYELLTTFAWFRRITRRKLDILCFDACLMGMLEGAFQFRDSVNYMIASEEEVETEGYPYLEMFRFLKRSPSVSPRNFAMKIVKQYQKYYEGKVTGSTLSVCDLAKVEDVTGSVKELATLLRRKLPMSNGRPAKRAGKLKKGRKGGAAEPVDEFPNVSPKPYRLRKAILEARKYVQELTVEGWLSSYIDLKNFCQLLKDFTSDTEIREACKRVIAKMNQGYVLYSASVGPEVKYSNGVSIYFPIRRAERYYTKLGFDLKTRWHDFLDIFLDRKEWNHFVKYEIFYFQKKKMRWTDPKREQLAEKARQQHVKTVNRQ